MVPWGQLDSPVTWQEEPYSFCWGPISGVLTEQDRRILGSVQRGELQGARVGAASLKSESAGAPGVPGGGALASRSPLRRAAIRSTSAAPPDQLRGPGAVVASARRVEDV